MKAYVILKNSLLAAAIGCALSGCYDPYYDHFSVSGSYSSGGSGVSYMYDSSGYPIYGYYGGRPIYAYDTFGSPIYSINLIRPNYYIPTWGPAPYYRGHYVRPHNCRPMAKPPMKPHFRPDHFRPGNNRPAPQPGRPNQRPDFGKPGNLQRPPVHHPGINQPGRPSRPSANNPSRPGGTNRPVINRPEGNRPSRPDFGRPSRPSTLPSSRPSAPNPGHSGINRPGRPSPVSRPSSPPHSASTQQAVLPSFICAIPSIPFTETLQSREFPRNAQEISFPEPLFIAGLFCSGDAKRPCIMASSRQRPSFSGIVQNPLSAAGENRLAGEKRFPVLECRNPFFNAPAPWTGEPASRYQWRCGTIRIRKNCAFADRIPSILQPAMRKAS